MPRYVISGTGIETGRPRRRTYEAEDEASARALAEADGTRCESITLEAEPPATDRQRAYARDLGISLRPDTTLEEASDLISAHVDGAINPHVASYLEALGRRVPHSQRNAASLISAEERLQWYLLNVCRHVLRGGWLRPNADGMPVDLSTLAARFRADPAAMKSYEQAESNVSERWPGLLAISSTGVGLEGTSTIAYRRARDLIADAAPRLATPPLARSPAVGGDKPRALPYRLRPCKECGNPIARDVRACPECGHRYDRVERSIQEMLRILPLLALAGFLMKCSWDASHSGERRRTACRANVSCWGEQHKVAAASACALPVQRLLHDPHRWEGDTLLLTVAGWAGPEQASVRYVGANLHVQRRSGAWVQYRYACTYEPETDRVLSASAEPLAND